MHFTQDTNQSCDILAGQCHLHPYPEVLSIVLSRSPSRIQFFAHSDIIIRDRWCAGAHIQIVKITKLWLFFLWWIAPAFGILQSSIQNKLLCISIVRWSDLHSSDCSCTPKHSTATATERAMGESVPQWRILVLVPGEIGPTATFRPTATSEARPLTCTVLLWLVLVIDTYQLYNIRVLRTRLKDTQIALCLGSV